MLLPGSPVYQSACVSVRAKRERFFTELLSHCEPKKAKLLPRSGCEICGAKTPPASHLYKQYHHEDRDVRVSQIHPTAVVSPRAELGKNVIVGPFCVIEDDVVVGDHCRLESRVTIKSHTTLGIKNVVEDGAILGGSPQHLAAGEQCGGLCIGDNNSIRENVTMHRALQADENTIVGNYNLIMVNTHIGHDTIVEDHTIMANNVMLAGHTVIGHHAYLAGATGVHQFCRIGHYTMVGGQSAIRRDVPPFVTVDGQTNCVVGLNVIGLRRNGFSAEDLAQLKRAYRTIYREGHTWNEVRELLPKIFQDGPATDFTEFFSSGKRGFVHERATPRKAFVPATTLGDNGSDLSVRRAS